MADLVVFEAAVMRELEAAGAGDCSPELAYGLVAIARARGARPHTIQLWISDSPHLEWSTAAYLCWLAKHDRPGAWSVDDGAV